MRRFEGGLLYSILQGLSRLVVLSVGAFDSTGSGPSTITISLQFGWHEINGRHEETRTPDLYRVNFEVKTLKPFPYLAFPHRLASEKAPKQPSFDGELMASSLVVLHLAMRCS